MKVIVKLSDGERSWYLEWSSVVDAPVTYGMSLDELRRHVKEQYGNEGLRELPKRLARCDARGTSAFDTTLERILENNRAGPNERQATREEIIRWYCLRESKPKK